MKSFDDAVRNHPFLLGLKPHHVAALCLTAAEVRFGPDECILREREPASKCYLITSGTVAIRIHSRTTHREITVDKLHSGDALGWSWLFAPFCWHFQAVAIEPVHAIALDGAALLVRCEEDHELGHALMKRMTQLMIRRLTAARRTIIELDAMIHPVEPVSTAAGMGGGVLTS